MRFEAKHAQQLEELRIASDTAIKELELLQNEKSKYQSYFRERARDKKFQ